jgi:hypothetical protein
MAAKDLSEGFKRLPDADAQKIVEGMPLLGVCSDAQGRIEGDDYKKAEFPADPSGIERNDDQILSHNRATFVNHEVQAERRQKLREQADNAVNE